MTVSAASRKPTELERFCSKLRPDESGCWLWAGQISTAGYGVFSRSRDGLVSARRQIEAHRYAYETLVGPIPDGLELDHLCRVKACVNPAHLEPVTHAENIRRAWVALRTSCPKGHAYDDDNTIVNARGHRRCRTCAREQAAAAYRRKKESAA